MVANFYEVSRTALDNLWRTASVRSWLSGKRGAYLLHALGGSERPARRYESDEPYFLSLLAALGDCELLGALRDDRADQLDALGKAHGGVWNVLDPSPEDIAAMDPDNFDPRRLRAFYAGEYWDDDDYEPTAASERGYYRGKESVAMKPWNGTPDRPLSAKPENT